MNELKTLRKQAHLTLAQTAQLLNVPVRTYENWENGWRVPPIYLYQYIVTRLKLVTMEEKEIKADIEKYALHDSIEIVKLYANMYGYIDTDIIDKIQNALKKEV